MVDGPAPAEASCASVAGVLKLARAGYFKKALRKKRSVSVVCILTGHGLKDPDRAIASSQKPKEVEPDLRAVVAAPLGSAHRLSIRHDC